MTATATKGAQQKPAKRRRSGRPKGGAGLVGWREWVRLPDLGIEAIKAKIDTGARSSSLHAFDLETFEEEGSTFVRFKIHPMQRRKTRAVEATAQVLEFRSVRSSSGHAAERPVIVTTLEILGRSWPIELTLANRDAMGFRLLLGRQAVRGRMVVDPGSSFYGGKPPRGKGKKRANKPQRHKAKRNTR